MFQKISVCCLLAIFAATVAVAQDSATRFDVMDGLITQQWVYADANGNVNGHVIVPVNGGHRPLDLAKVSLVPLNGLSDTVVRSKSMLDGSFSFSGVRRGTYAVVASSTDFAAVYALHVLPQDEKPGHDAQDLLLTTAPVSVTALIDKMSRYKPLEDKPQHAVYGFDSDPIAQRNIALRRRVVANADGTLSGHLSLPVGHDGKRPELENMNVMIVNGDETLDTQVVNRDGTFKTTKAIAPGVYGLVAVGQSGFAAVGFELFGSQTASLSNASGHRFVSVAAQASELHVEIVPYSQAVIDELKSEKSSYEEMPPAVQLNEFGWPATPDSMAGNNFGGGSGMGNGYGGSGSGGMGGGGAGGGGLGSLAGLGAIGAAVAAGNNDGNGNIGGIVVASPSSP